MMDRNHNRLLGLFIEIKSCLSASHILLLPLHSVDMYAGVSDDVSAGVYVVVSVNVSVGVSVGVSASPLDNPYYVLYPNLFVQCTQLNIPENKKRMKTKLNRN